ncbi:AsmA family protein [Rhodohalobacter sp. 614A]|uniref:AsmA family protein n=1 Tax=Rhodohalobacter sp. 614A TaxID=2908649 RepID=UPI001F2A4D07|nr:AsmA family protein [Rhodohalobacter sp. 614A]
MRTFLKILAGVLIFLILALVGLNLYFTDERLKETVLPKVREATGSDIQVSTMSITFFRTFPQFGVELDEILVPDPESEPVATIDELLLSLEFFSLFGDEISISNLDVRHPTVFYTVYEDSTTNIDFLLENFESEEDTTAQSTSISISGFELTDGSINYRDQTNHSSLILEDLDADISLSFGEIIESTIDAELASLSYSVGETVYLEDLALSMDQTSTLDMENEILTFSEGTFSIRGLALDLSGSVSKWSSEAPEVSLNFSSSSENFGELLRLAPPEYEEQLSGLETSGSLVLEGNVEGSITEGSYPNFNITVQVQDGYLQDPDLPEAIQNINISAVVNNELATIDQFSAEAGENHLRGSGRIERPLEDNASFTLDATGDINLATISSFYPIDEVGIERLSGQLNLDATANGRMDDFENTDFSGEFILADGSLKYADVPNSIEEINARIDANQNRIQIAESGFTAETNQFRLSGTIMNPLDENQRTVDVVSNVNFDLATIKNFYPIDEDTLSMRGKLVAEVALKGRPDPDQIETVLQSGTIELTNGFLSHKSLANPIRDITFRANASGRTLNITEANFATGENALAVNGSVTDYLSDEPVINLNLDGDAVFGSITQYYSLEPMIQELTGNAALNLNVRGPIGNAENMSLNGSFEVENVTARGDSLPLPVTQLSGRMTATPQQMNLERFSMNFGESDIQLEGSLQNYMAFLGEQNSTSAMPTVNGTYTSSLVNVDEMINWEEETDAEPTPVELPDMVASVRAEIDRLQIFGLSITNISGNGRMTPNTLGVSNATAQLFGGEANGNMEWSIPDPLNTSISFEGKLDSLQAKSFFRDTGFLGPKSTIHQYLTGAFSADIEYSAQLQPNLSPDIETAEASGTFGMTKVRLSGHPIQQKIAEYLKVSELSTLTLDRWNANFTMADAVMTLENFKLTSGNLGLELNGTLNMVSDQIDYKATVLLPERFKKGIASVISTRAADALQLEDGRLAVPLQVTGTTASPKVGPDTVTIDQIVRDYVQQGAKNVLRNLLDGSE